MAAKRPKKLSILKQFLAIFQKFSFFSNFSKPLKKHCSNLGKVRGNPYFSLDWVDSGHACLCRLCQYGIGADIHHWTWILPRGSPGQIRIPSSGLMDFETIDFHWFSEQNHLQKIFMYFIILLGKPMQIKNMVPKKICSENQWFQNPLILTKESG